MSDTTNPPPAKEPPFKPSEITFDDLHNEPPPVPAPVPTAVPPPVQEPLREPVSVPVSEPANKPAPATTEPEPIVEQLSPISLDELLKEPAAPAVVTEDTVPTDVPGILRKQIKTQKKEHEDAMQEWQDKVNAAEAREAEARQELVVQNPLLDEKVLKANDDLNTEIKAIARGIGAPDAARKFLEKAKVFSDQYAKLGDVYSDGYDERYAQLQESMRSELGSKAETVMQNMPRLEDLRTKMEEAVQNASSSSGSMRLDRAAKIHEESTTAFNRAVSDTLEYNDELAKEDQFATQNIVAKMREVVPHFKEMSDSLMTGLRDSMIPPKPLLAEDVPTMSQEQRDQANNGRVESFGKNYQRLQELTPLAFNAMQMVPILARSLAEERAKNKQLMGEQPAPSAQFGNPSPAPKVLPPGTETPKTGFRPIDQAELYA